MDATLSSLYRERLDASDVSERAASYAKLSALAANDVAKLWAKAPKQPAIRINYLDPLGKPTEFYRLRLLGKTPGFALERPIRYLQPPGSGVRCYFPRVLNLNWMEILTDPKHAIIITEGEFKALAACINGFPTIGLGGVENWRSAREGKALIDELAAINWKDRALHICYDSDAISKPQVGYAAQRLAEELGSRGAVVYDSGLPSSADEKVGLDDFLLANGATALRKHLSNSLPFDSVKALHEFNRRFVFIRSSCKVYEYRVREAYESSRFVNAVEANNHYNVLTVTKDGPKIQKKSTAGEWMKWANRSTVQRQDYRPGIDQKIITHNGVLYLNLWDGWGCKPEKGDTKPWETLFKHIINGESAEFAKWLEQWLAYPLQNPGSKLYTAVAVWGPTQGTGKTLLGETMIRIYGSNGQRVEAKDLDSAFNGWAQYKQFILGDEITGNDSRTYADQIKNLITGESIRVNEKFEKAYDQPNRINFYFTSNHPDAFFLEDRDRRMAVMEAPPDTLSPEFYANYQDWMNGDGPAALFHYLLNVDLTGFNPRGPAPMTQAKEIMIEQGKSDVGRFVHAVMMDPQYAERAYGVPPDVDIFTVNELYNYYDPRKEKKASEKAVSLELQRQGAAKLLRGTQIHVEGLGRCRVYAVRSIPTWRKATRESVMRGMRMRKMIGPKY